LRILLNILSNTPKIPLTALCCVVDFLFLHFNGDKKDEYETQCPDLVL